MSTTTTETETPRASYPEGWIGVPLPLPTPAWDPNTGRRTGDAKGLARALGWFSVGVGAAELLAPERITEFLGMNEDRAEMVRFCGLGRVAGGLGMLSQRDPAPWVWSRVAGDFVDIAGLATTLSSRNPQRNRVAGALAVVAGVTALDLLCTSRLRAES